MIMEYGLNYAPSPNESAAAPEITGFWKETGKALRIIRLNGETISSVSQSRPAFKYGLIFMLLPNTLLFLLILLSGVYIGFANLLVSLAQSFLIIGLSFLTAKFLFKGRGTLDGYFRPASYSFIFLFITPLIVLIYAPLPVFAGLLAVFVVLLGFWNIVVLAKSLKQTQNIGTGKSIASVLIALFVLSLGLSSATVSLRPEQAGPADDLPRQGGLPVQSPEDINENVYFPEQEQQSEVEQFEDEFPSEDELPSQGIILTPEPEPQQSVEPEETSPTMAEAAQQTVMGGMSTHMMQQISHGIWSGNYYNPMIP